MAVIVDYPAHEVILRLLKKERRSVKAKAVWWDANYEPETDANANWRDWQVSHWRVDAAHLDRLITELESGHDAVCLHLRAPSEPPRRRRKGGIACG